ncbi:MAG: hypothetical protein PF445_06630 [Melioribacteraceae bacterium]|jgi:hypothetical protein|nr:hypothetical protein [Melioribacteraceae bacterium]
MGHKRYGYLPKTKRWLTIVEELAELPQGDFDVTSIVNHTLKNVQSRFSRLEEDPSIHSSFEFLLQLSHAFQQNDPIKYLKDNGIIEHDELSVLKLGRALKKYKKDDAVSLEYQTFSRQAAIDALNQWYKANLDSGVSFFNEEIDDERVFRNIGKAGGFSDLTREYFSSFTERYLKYYLEREASSAITNINEREQFNEGIKRHVNDISKHAFETTKITQSFSAAWFNKNARESIPTAKQIKKFLSYAFNKMKGELLREESK